MKMRSWTYVAHFPLSAFVALSSQTMRFVVQFSGESELSNTSRRPSRLIEVQSAVSTSTFPRRILISIRSSFLGVVT